ncbi:MAG: class II aldolase/adducin family protein [Candidatus Berkiella sp.]
MLNEAMIEELVKISQFLCAKGFAPATKGNFSARLDDKSFVIGGANKDKSVFTKYDFIICDLQANVISGDACADCATHLHGFIYNQSPYTNCVLQSYSKPIQVLSRLNQHQPYIHLNEKRIVVYENNTNLLQNIQSQWETVKQQQTFVVHGLGLFSMGLTVFDAKRLMEELEFLADCELSYLSTNQRI